MIVFSFKPLTKPFTGVFGVFGLRGRLSERQELASKVAYQLTKPLAIRPL